jgi:tRNA dimethylallyltransferase
MAQRMPLVAIVGPTGSGKSSIAVEVAKTLAAEGVTAEIVSADAMQLYRGMDVGTAKITPEEASGVPHHLLDVWEPTEEASVQDYQERARAAISDCFGRGVLPILVGGSGLYVSSVIYQFDFPGTDEGIRARLESELEHDGLHALAQRLVGVDPDAAEGIDLNNPRRVVRALEVWEITGELPTIGLQARGELWHQPTLIVGVEWPRDELVESINSRVSQMWNRGLVDEVRALHDAGELGKTAGQAIGYREVVDFLNGDISEAEAKDAVAQHTRRYARKQMSWFRRDSSIHWVDPTEGDPVATMVQAVTALWPGLDSPAQ